jgi:hypothetical protein
MVELSKGFHPRLGSTVEDLDRWLMNYRAVTEEVAEYLRHRAKMHRQENDENHVNGYQGRHNPNQYSAGDC